MAFQDLFSGHAGTYLRYRPVYPDSLFEWLCSLTNEQELAWDCGTGNGQSACMLADHFKKVYATDPSTEQIKHAIPHEKVVYRIEKAEEPSLENKTVDLVTVAQALHWFDFEKFYPEVKRVVKPGGVIAAWAYGLPEVSKEINGLTRHFHDEILGEFWQKENRLIDAGYITIPFPFTEIPAPDFYIRKLMGPDELLGHLFSWSATQKFISRHGADPVKAVAEELKKLWPAGEKEVSWKLIMKAGRI